MTPIRIDEIRRDPLAWLRRVEEGETLVVPRDMQLVAEIRPVRPVTHQHRPFGLCAGRFTVPPDFDQPLPGRILNEFDGR